jgi:hypothetical protein
LQNKSVFSQKNDENTGVPVKMEKRGGLFHTTKKQCIFYRENLFLVDRKFQGLSFAPKT